MGKRQDAARETRKRLLEAAAAIGSERGFDELAVEDVTARAGVAKGTFYTHFRRREDIIAEIAFAPYADLAERLRREAADAEESIARFLVESVGIIERQGLRTAQQWMSNAMEPTGKDAPGAVKFQFDAGYVRESLERDVGSRCAEALARSVSEQITAHYYGIVALWCITDGEFDMPAATRDFCRTVLRDYLDAFTRRLKNMSEDMETVLLNDGNRIPIVGFGVFLIPNDGAAYAAVRQALEDGYRHIDTAAAYFNEEEVGRAIRDSGIPRGDIFVTSKLWIQDYGCEAALRGMDASLSALGVDYIDLYLLHQPYGDVEGAWRALEKGKSEGKLRSIGVSNMTPGIWNKFVPNFDSLPAVNQVECNPFFQQRPLRELLAPLDVKIEAYYPLGHGNAELLGNELIVSLAEKYGKHSAQIILRFETQDGLIVLPKSTKPERIAGNIDIFDFELTEEEMEKLRALDTGVGSHDPEAPGMGDYLLANYKVHD